MAFKGAAIFSIAMVLFSLPVLAVEKDWASVVIALKPKRGQNFEQDLQLARAYFSLERRIDALRVLNDYADGNPEHKAQRMLDLVSSQFYNQETANAYYEAVQAISQSKWAEARERLEPALVKEPGNGQLLLRLIQVETLLKLKEPLTDHLELAEELTPFSKEVKVFAAKKAMDDGEDREAYRLLNGQRSMLSVHPTILLWWLEVVSKLKKTSEIQPIQARLLKEHPQWSAVIRWFLESRWLSKKEIRAFQAQLDKNLKDPSQAAQAIEAENKKTQYYWAGYFTVDTLKLPIATPTPVPSPTATSDQ